MTNLCRITYVCEACMKLGLINKLNSAHISINKNVKGTNIKNSKLTPDCFNFSIKGS